MYETQEQREPTPVVTGAATPGGSISTADTNLGATGQPLEGQILRRRSRYERVPTGNTGDTGRSPDAGSTSAANPVGARKTALTRFLDLFKKKKKKE